MRNIEIKAYVHDIDNIIKIANELSDKPLHIIKQHDVFYNVINGRLKMRFYGEDSGGENSATLVRYEREDTEGPKLADYDLLQISKIDEAKLLDEILKKTISAKGTVIKERKLFMVDQTRIHIDSVEGLGNFMELEVVLRDDQTLDEGRLIAKDLQKKLGVKDEDLIDCAYLDLLLKDSKLHQQ